MNRYRVSVHIQPRRGILDPQGAAVTGALHSLGFTRVSDTRIGKHVVLELDAADARAADTEARAMCERLLANPVTEEFEIAGVQGL